MKKKLNSIILTLIILCCNNYGLQNDSIKNGEFQMKPHDAIIIFLG